MCLAVNLTYRMAERQGQKSQEPAGEHRRDLTRSPKIQRSLVAMVTRSELAAPGVWVLLPDCRDKGDRLVSPRDRPFVARRPVASARSCHASNAVTSLTATGQPGSASNNHRPTPGIPGPASRWNAGGRCPLLRHEPIGGAPFGGDRAGRCGVTRVRLRRLFAAIRSAQLGITVAVVEEKYWGGVCLSVGCIPSKALLRNAELAHLVNSEAKPSGIHSMAPSGSTIRLLPVHRVVAGADLGPAMGPGCE